MWKSKVDKVQRSIITQDYFSGGMRIVDINNFITSLKCSWIKILTKSSKTWMDIFTINEHDYLQKIIDFGVTVLLECLY